MSIPRKLIIAALAAGAAVATGAAPPALASTTQPATVQQIGTIHKAPCTRLTFNVYYGTSKRVCYAGIGSLRVDIPNVHRITTGENMGLFTVRIKQGTENRYFAPNEIFSFLTPHTELVYLQLDPLLNRS